MGRGPSEVVLSVVLCVSVSSVVQLLSLRLQSSATLRASASSAVQPFALQHFSHPDHRPTPPYSSPAAGASLARATASTLPSTTTAPAIVHALGRSSSRSTPHTPAKTICR